MKQAALCGAGSDAVALRIDSSRPHVGLEISRAVQAGWPLLSLSSCPAPQHPSSAFTYGAALILSPSRRGAHGGTGYETVRG